MGEMVEIFPTQELQRGSFAFENVSLRMGKIELSRGDERGVNERRSDGRATNPRNNWTDRRKEKWLIAAMPRI
jgi:hypothetical protein